VREEAVKALGKLDSQDARIIPAILAALTDKDETVRQVAVEVLGQLDSQDARIIPALLTALKDKDLDVRTAAVNSLETLLKPSKALKTRIETALGRLAANESKPILLPSTCELKISAQPAETFIEIDSQYWYTDADIDSLLKRQLAEDSITIYAAHYPFIIGKSGQQAAALLQSTLKQCLQAQTASVIPLNCLEQVIINEYDLSNDTELVGTHWIGLIVEPKKDSYQLTLIDSCGNGLDQDKDLTHSSLLDILSLLPEDHPRHKVWERAACLIGLLKGLIQQEALTIDWNLVVTGLAQQDDAVSCGPLLVANCVDWLKTQSLQLQDPLLLRQQHAELMQRASVDPNLAKEPESSANCQVSTTVKKGEHHQSSYHSSLSLFTSPQKNKRKHAQDPWLDGEKQLIKQTSLPAEEPSHQFHAEEQLYTKPEL
ncbi:MAG: repeat-containing protein, partial [Gammaproteobacteria bacterium]|nr:repeat-containing protein [Gammaproteobacteria bacterium]